MSEFNKAMELHAPIEADIEETEEPTEK